MPELKNIPLDQIMEPPAPMRVSMDEAALYELRDSIRALGMLQPIIVVPAAKPDGVDDKQVQAMGAPLADGHPPQYEIVAGHRRYLAARLVPLAELPCMVYSDGSLAKEAAMLAENVYREDVTAAEEGFFYCELIEKHTLTEAQLCAMVKQSPEYIYARMDMVRKDELIAQLNAQRKINFTVAKELLKCPDPAHRQYLAQMAADSGATGSVVKSWVAQWRAQTSGPQEPLPIKESPDAGSPVHDNTVKCWCCGGEKDPQNLRLIYLHWYELDSLKRVLTEAGMAPGGAAASAVAP
jgi:ParB/RepB/Spo0J family partition protein